MKRTKFIMAVLLMTAISCSRTDEVIPDGDIRYVCFEIRNPSTDNGSDTKATIVNNGQNFVWETTDTVGIYPDSGSQVFFSMADGAGTNYSVFDGGGWALKNSSTYYSYYPFIGDMYLDKDKIPVNFLGQYQRGTDNFDHISDYLYMTSKGTVTGGSLTFSYKHLCSFLYLKLSAPQGSYKSVTLSLKEPLWVTSGSWSLMDASPAIEGSTFSDIYTVSLEDFVIDDPSKQYVVNFMAAPVDLNGRQVTVTLESNDGQKYVYNKTPSKPYLAGVRYGLSCSSYETVETVSDADALQQAITDGASNVEVTEVPTDDVNLDLSGVSKDISIVFPTEESKVQIAMSYPDDEDSYPSSINIIPPVNSSMDINTPKSSVSIDQATVTGLVSRTAKSTLVIKSSTQAGHVRIIKGGVINSGVVDTLDFSALEESITLLNYGKIHTVIGLDEDWNTASGHHVELYEASGSSIGDNNPCAKLKFGEDYEAHSPGMLYCSSVYRSPKNMSSWEKYAHGVFDTPSDMLVRTDTAYRYKIDVQCVVNGTDSLYHYNDLYEGTTGVPLYHERGRKMNKFVYHDTDNSNDGYYESVHYGTTWYAANNYSKNSSLRLFYGSAVIDGAGINAGESIQIPLYYARCGIRVQCHGITDSNVSVQVALKMQSAYTNTLTKDNASFYMERSMYDLVSMMNSISDGQAGFEGITLSLKYVKKTTDVTLERYILKDQHYDIPRDQVTTFDLTINNDGVGEDGFIIKYDSSSLEDGNSYDFPGTITE